MSQFCSSNPTFHKLWRDITHQHPPFFLSLNTLQRSRHSGFYGIFLRRIAATADRFSPPARVTRPCLSRALDRLGAA